MLDATRNIAALMLPLDFACQRDDAVLDLGLNIVTRTRYIPPKYICYPFGEALVAHSHRAIETDIDIVNYGFHVSDSLSSFLRRHFLMICRNVSCKCDGAMVHSYADKLLLDLGIPLELREDILFDLGIPFSTHVSFLLLLY